MPQLQNLVLTDRTPTTPANITFTPQGLSAQGVGTVSASTGVPVGDKRVSVSMQKRNSRYKGEVRLVLPILATETINGISRPTVIRTGYVTLNVDFDERSTEQERTDAVGMLASGLATSKTLINDALVKLESVY